MGDEAEKMRAWWRRLRREAPRVWRSAARVHVEVRPLVRGADPEALDAALREALERVDGVAWARLNGALRRAVVALERADVDVETLVRLVRQAEERAGASGARYALDATEYPGDLEPRLRVALEAAVDFTALLAAVLLRVMRVRTAPAEVDVAALLNMLEGVPRFRKALQRRLGWGGTDLAFGLANAMVAGLLKGWTGPLTDLARRGLLAAELSARAELWARLEPALCGRPEDHLARPAVRRKRPTPFPDGPVEAYSGQAVPASLGGFVSSLASSHSMEGAAANLFGGMPRPAKLGREGFAASLGRRLAKRGVLVLRTKVLRRLERIDVVAVADDLLAAHGWVIGAVLPVEGAGVDAEEARRHVEALFDPEHPATARRDDGWSLHAPLVARRRTDGEEARALAVPGGIVLGLHRHGETVALAGIHPVVDARAEALVARIRRSGLRLIVVAERPERVAWAQPDTVIAGDDALADAVRAEQRAGRAVAVIAAGSSPGLHAADCGIGLRLPDRPPPWGGHLLCGNGLEDARFLVEAMAAGRDAANQAVGFAVAEAAVGAMFASAGLERRTTQRVMAAANAAALLAMANGMRIAAGVRGEAPATAVHRVPWHALPVETVLEQVRSRREGLTWVEAESRRTRVDPQASGIARLARLCAEELSNPMTPILAGGAALSSAVEGPADGAIAASVLGINGLVGGLQRQRTEKALSRLRREDGRRVRTRRDGREVEILAGALVPGDIVALQAGDVVPADLRLIEAAHLEADESSLTGESLPVRKDPAPSLAAAVADRSSMLYEGTTVAAGSALGVVVAVGGNTESRCAVPGETDGPPETGVEARLDQITRYTLPAALVSGLSVAAAGLVRGRSTRDMVGAGVALAIAAVPEGLPLLATMAQLAAARRLALQGALVRNPRAVEALGRVDLLCADKTGTLTEGRIRLKVVSDGGTARSPAKLEAAHRHVLATALRANPDGDPARLPHPTDRALARGARRANVAVDERRAGWRRVAELPFEAARGYHATLGDAGRSQWLCVKGAPEVVLPRCVRQGRARLDDAARARLAAHVDEMARRGLRVLAVAERRMTKRRKRLDDAAVGDLTFVGFVGLADPVRATARQAVDDLKRAGVQVTMLTGDHPSTAEAIAAELGLLNGEPVMTGPTLDRLDDDRLASVLGSVKVFARVTPAHKVRIVKAFQKAGRVVAMTGDGANDAPAIRLADVGIALGERSTPAARGAADLVVTDERIETIVRAILEGRALWSAVRDAVSILVGGNLGEIAFTLFGGLVDGTSPLNGRQLLLVNLLTDALPALAIALRRPRGVTPEQLLREGPEASLGEALTRDLAWRAAITSASTSAAWIAARLTGSRERASSVALLTLVGTQLGQTLLAGGRSPSVLAAGVGSLAALLGAVETPGVSGFFGSTPVGPLGLVQAGVASTMGTAAAAVLPPIADRLGPRVARTAVVKRLRASPWPRRVVRAFASAAPDGAAKRGGDWRRYVPFAGR